MKVQELIEELMKFDLDATVVVPAYDDNGLNDMRRIKQVFVIPHSRPESYGAGKYDEAYGDNTADHAAVVIE